MNEEEIQDLARQKFRQRLDLHEWETRRKMVQAMRDNGADPAYIYAFEKTGLLVFQENKDMLSPEELELWAEAYEEYSPD